MSELLSRKNLIAKVWQFEHVWFDVSKDHNDQNRKDSIISDFLIAKITYVLYVTIPNASTYKDFICFKSFFFSFIFYLNCMQKFNW